MIFAEVSFRVRYGAPQVRSLTKFGVNLYRKTPQPQSYFSQWSPSFFFIDDVAYPCAEQHMMAEKARLFHDHDTAERIMASPDPREHKRLGRGMHNFDCPIWDRIREGTVYAGTFAKFTQNPAMKQHLLSASFKCLVKASPFDPEWDIGLRADDPNPVAWGKFSRGSSFRRSRK